MASRDQTRPSPTSGATVGASPSDESSTAPRTGDPRSVVTELADAAMSEARAAGDRVSGVARERARSVFSRQQRVLSDQIRGVADALRDTAQKLEKSDSGLPGRYIGEAADRAEDFAEALEARGMEDLADELEMFARRQPELFLGASVGVGLLLGRFLKASSERRRVSRPPAQRAGSRRAPYDQERQGAAGFRASGGFAGNGREGEAPGMGAEFERGTSRATGDAPASMGAGAGGYGTPVGGTGVGGLGDMGSGRAGASGTADLGKTGASPLGAGAASDRG